MANNVYFWGRREKEIHNTPRHQIIRKELHSIAQLPPKEFNEKFEEFKKKYPELIINKKELEVKKSWQ